MAKLDERKLETALDFLLSGIYDYPDLNLAPIDQAAIQHVVAILDKISEDAFLTAQDAQQREPI